MKILVISQQYYPDNFRINDICQELVKRGHTVTVVTSLPDYQTGRIPKEYKWFRKRKEVIEGVAVRRLWSIARRTGTLFRIFNYLSFLFSSYLYACFAKCDFDVIYYWQATPITSGSCAKKFKQRSGKKLLLYCLDLWPESLKVWGFREGTKFYQRMLRFSKTIYRAADKLCVSSKPFVQYLTDVIGLNAEEITYLPQHFEADYSHIASQFPSQTDACNLIFAGNIGKAQDVATIIKAAAQLKDLPQVKFHIVGDGSDLDRCKALATQLGVEKTVIFYGKRPFSEMEQFYQSAHGFLLTLEPGSLVSLTLPGKLQGYMAAGRPIFAAIDGAASGVISEANCGYCALGGDSKTLADLIRAHACDYEQLKCLGSNAKTYYDQHFGTTIHMDELEQLLQALRQERD